MIHPPRQILHTLIQAATQRHIQFLHAATNREQGDTRRNGSPDQGQGGGIAVLIFRRALGMGGAVIMAGPDIGPATGQNQAIDVGKVILCRILTGCGQQHRGAAHRAAHHAHIAVRRRVIGRSEDAEGLYAA